jgi:hypothetical protein
MTVNHIDDGAAQAQTCCMTAGDAHIGAETVLPNEPP